MVFNYPLSATAFADGSVFAFLSIFVLDSLPSSPVSLSWHDRESPSGTAVYTVYAGAVERHRAGRKRTPKRRFFRCVMAMLPAAFFAEVDP